MLKLTAIKIVDWTKACIVIIFLAAGNCLTALAQDSSNSILLLDGKPAVGNFEFLHLANNGTLMEVPSHTTSAVEIHANPELFMGKRLTAYGYLHVGDNGKGLHLAQDKSGGCEIAIETRNPQSIFIASATGERPSIESLNGKKVLLEGLLAKRGTLHVTRIEEIIQGTVLKRLDFAKSDK